MIAFTLLAALAVLLIGLSEHPESYVLIGMLSLLTLWPIIRGLKKRGTDWFEPIYGVGFMYFLYFCLYTIYILETPWKEGRLGEFSPELFNRALFFTCVGYACLLLGYHSFLPGALLKALPTLRALEGRQALLSVAYAAYAIGMSLRLFLASKGLHIKHSAASIVPDLPPIYYIIDYLTLLTLFGYMLANMAYYSDTRSRSLPIILWGFMCPLEALFAMFSGSKFAFIPLLTTPVIAYHYFRGPISVRRLLLPIPIMVLVITPIITAYRLTDAPSLRSMAFFDGMSVALQAISSYLSSLSWSEYLYWSYETCMERVNGSGAFGLVIEAVPGQMDYQYGKTFITILSLLIPTVLWPGKYDFYNNVLNWGELIFNKRDTGGIAITQIGELYLNFAMAGVVVGMFLLGVMYKTLYLYCMRRKDINGVFIYSLLWIMLIFIELPFGPLFANMFKQCMILFLIVFLMNRGRLFETRAEGRPLGS